MTTYISTPPVKIVRACFEYDAANGVLIWKQRPRDHFINDRAWQTFERQFAGREAFPTVSKAGYRYGTFQVCGIYYRVFLHRLIWAHQKGFWPLLLDHVDTDRLRNKIENLREATASQNQGNRSRRKRPTDSGAKCVFTTPSGRFTAQIRRAGKSIHLGTFNTPEEASAAYAAAAREQFGDFARC